MLTNKTGGETWRGVGVQGTRGMGGAQRAGGGKGCAKQSNKPYTNISNAKYKKNSSI